MKKINRKKQFISSILAVLFFLSVSQLLASQENKDFSINGYMPEQINVKTLTQTFCKGYDFSIYNGKIWSKSPEKTEWSLFLGTGLPFCKTDERLAGHLWFESPAAVTEIAADGDCIFVFDDNGKIYKLLTDFSTVDKPFEWLDTFGWPTKLTLTKDEKFQKARVWGTGIRRKDILYYTDSFGNDHHFGTMGLETLYFLTENGQEIRFTDSGLPASFSKTILGPERGAFIAENMSVSGSTLFLINDAGEMYTRLIDYDTMGCDPMFFKYTYSPKKEKLTGKKYRSNYTPWALPNEDWKKQPEIPLKDKAKLARYISISQNGKGNSARSLRVAGLSAEGKTGFYIKQIDDEKWEFKEAELFISENDYLKYANSADYKNEEIKKSIRGKKHEFAYSGYVYKNNKKLESLECTITDFPLTTEGSCNLEITDTETGESKSILLYPLELWTFITQKDPGFDGTSRNYFVTPSFNPEILRSKNGEFGTVLSDIFIGTNLQLYSFSASATTDYIDISGKDSSEYRFFLTAEPIDISPDEYKANLLFSHPLIETSISESSLYLDESKNYSIVDVPEIYEVINANKNLLKLLKKDSEEFQAYSANATKTRWGYNFLDLLTSITFLNKVDFPKIKTITMYGNDIMKNNAVSFQSMAEYRMFVYPFVIKLIQKRIEIYEDFLQEISKSTSPKINPYLRKNYNEYFNDAGIPEKLNGKSDLILDNKVEIERIKKVPMYPALKLNSGNNSILVELPDFVNAFFDYKQKNTELKCNAEFRIVKKEIEKNKKSILEKALKKEGTFEFSGNTIIVCTNEGKILFSGEISSSNKDSKPNDI